VSAQLDLLDSRARWERLVPITLDRLRAFEPDEGYVLAYSGGKDSDCLLALAKEAGVRFEAVHHLTTVDPPEVVAHVKAHPEVTITRSGTSMYKLIKRKGLPSAVRRWCCQHLKEHKYPHRIVLTGVRWSESARRSTRRMVETAYRCKSQRFLHPILDWKAADVWGYLRARGVETCCLYDEGWTRLGCVCCPLGTTGEREAARWPRIAASLRRAWDHYCDSRPDLDSERERLWGRFLRGEIGRNRGKTIGCPLFADVRDGEESP